MPVHNFSSTDPVEKLAAVDEMIANVGLSQSYNTPLRSQRHADLQWLIQLRKEIQLQVAFASGVYGSVVTQVDNPEDQNSINNAG